MSINAGGNLNSTPNMNKVATNASYVDLQNSTWAQQYLPDLMEKEAEVFGNRTISGFLSQVGAEEAMAADQVIWSEQGRLHIKEDVTVTTAADGLLTTAAAHNFRAGDTIVLHKAGITLKCYISEVLSATTVTALPYTQADLGTSAAFADADVAVAFVYGSEFGKGTNGRVDSLEPGMKSFANKPIIVKDKYMVNGSDASAIGWIEVSGEDGQNGYLWYLKAQGDTMSRFTDYCEMAVIEGEKNSNGSTAGVAGTEGLFAAIKDRGHATDEITGTSSTNDLASFDAILKKFDAQGAIEENMMFVNRDVSLAIDDMLAGMNAGYSNGTSYGVFNNDADMALNLGFSGFRRGSYDFYKSDWKYLNDSTTRGAIADVRGVIVPAGVSSVYDQQLGKNLKRPFLHVRYRASQTESRKMKSWVTGSVGAVTSDLDAMEINYLTERCLVVQGANNFMLMN